ncbi:MAG: hypothetical protein LBR65_05575 [Culturomica sp.]|jgi:hypothetical protein|nr:hypothetical protein [Culturomica sp.]
MKKYWDSIGIFVLAVLYFFTMKGVLPSFLYTITALLLSIVIVPGKLLLLFKNEHRKVLETYFYMISNVVVAGLIALTVVVMYLPENDLLTLGILICRIINIICLLYFILNAKRQDAIFCLSALFLPSYWSI